jgi:hypothetical protein
MGNVYSTDPNVAYIYNNVGQYITIILGKLTVIPKDFIPWKIDVSHNVILDVRLRNKSSATFTSAMPNSRTIFVINTDSPISNMIINRSRDNTPVLISIPEIPPLSPISPLSPVPQLSPIPPLKLSSSAPVPPLKLCPTPRLLSPPPSPVTTHKDFQMHSLLMAIIICYDNSGTSYSFGFTYKNNSVTHIPVDKLSTLVITPKTTVVINGLRKSKNKLVDLYYSVLSTSTFHNENQAMLNVLPLSDFTIIKSVHIFPYKYS